ncbi:MAG: nucleotidyltransferase family protein [Nitrososphaerota archaeon]|nr:nucleotidyltransferase family protein [Nitrososphaerota archaeon]
MGNRERGRVAAVVLAAGTSSRMGFDKQLAPVMGRPMLQRVLDMVKDSSADEIVLVLGHDGDRVGEVMDTEGTRVVQNRRYRDGLSSSLKMALRLLGRDVQAAVVVLGDQPFVRSDTVDRIIGAYRRSTAEAVVPVCGGRRGNPVLLSRVLFDAVMDLEGDTGAKSVLRSARVEEVEVEDEGVLVDVDTPADLRT